MLKNYTPLDTGEVGQLIGLVDYADGDTLFSFIDVKVRNGKLLVNGDTLATVDEAELIPGPYKSDFLAGEGGIGVGKRYYVDDDNIYLVPKGFVRVRLAITGLLNWIGQNGLGEDEYWSDEISGPWVGDDN